MLEYRVSYFCLEQDVLTTQLIFDWKCASLLLLLILPFFLDMSADGLTWQLFSEYFTCAISCMSQLLIWWTPVGEISGQTDQHLTSCICPLYPVVLLIDSIYHYVF